MKQREIVVFEIIKFLEVSGAGERKETQAGVGGKAGRACLSPALAAGTVAGIVYSFCFMWGCFCRGMGRKNWDFCRGLMVMKDTALQENSFINSTANRAAWFCFPESDLNVFNANIWLLVKDQQNSNQVNLWSLYREEKLPETLICGY